MQQGGRELKWNSSDRWEDLIEDLERKRDNFRKLAKDMAGMMVLSDQGSKCYEFQAWALSGHCGF